MVRFFVLLGIVCATAIGFAFVLESGAEVEVLGMPSFCVAETDFCWLSLLAGAGVVFVGAAGVGLVCVGFGTAGLLFGVGQIACGGICIAQLGLGFSAFLGQVGGGVVAMGQGVLGGVVVGQGQAGFDGREFLRGLSDEFNGWLGGEVPPELAWRSSERE